MSEDVVFQVEVDAAQARMEDGTPFTARDILEAAACVRRDRGDGWRAIASAPKDGTWVLTFEMGQPLAAVTRWQSGAWKTPLNDFVPQHVSGDPTHWRPLPAPPNTAPAEEEVVRLRRERDDWIDNYNTLKAIRITSASGEPSREWLRENLRHHIGRHEDKEAKALITVAQMTLNTVDYDWFIEPIVEGQSA